MVGSGETGEGYLDGRGFLVRRGDTRIGSLVGSLEVAWLLPAKPTDPYFFRRIRSCAC
jgi:hypothetical protein